MAANDLSGLFTGGTTPLDFEVASNDEAIAMATLNDGELIVSGEGDGSAVIS